VDELVIGITRNYSLVLLFLGAVNKKQVDERSNQAK
jgi:hypothetical protein